MLQNNSQLCANLGIILMININKTEDQKRSPNGGNQGFLQT